MPSWLLRYEVLNFRTVQQNLAADPEYPEPSFLDES
jgi:hypothetical protein